MSLITKVDDFSSNSNCRKCWFALACIIFFAIIVLPSIFVIFSIPSEWDGIREIISDPSKMGLMWGAVWNSFSLAFVVTMIDIVMGLPMAWMLVRKNYRFNKYLDTLIDLPLAFPTVALGFSVVLFWGCPEGVTVPGTSLVVDPYLMMIFLHLIFTYPYMVRSLSGILEQIDINYETAAMTLGASKFTAVRTITLPLFRAGLITGFILCFARSLSETGGTYVSLVLMGAVDEGTLTGFFTGPTLISAYRSMSGGGSMPELILISSVLIVLALGMLMLARTVMSRIKMPWSKVWPTFGRRISKPSFARGKDVVTLVFAFFVVFLPSFYLFSFLTTPGSFTDYSGFIQATLTSFLVAGVATAFDVVFGMPVAMYIARNKNKLSALLDNLVNVPLIIPTTALGFSLALFWGDLGLSSMGLLLVIFGHISFTYPLLVRNIIGAVEEVNPSYEEIARTLGAKPFQAFRKILFPFIQSSLISGAILSFTRSLGETGATQAIDPSIITIPTYIVSLINSDLLYEAGIASMLLIVISFVIMFGFKIFVQKMGGRD